MQWFYQLGGVLQAFLASLFMVAMTSLGAACVFFSKKVNQKVLTALTGLASGIMISASIFSLLIPATEYGGSGYIVPLGFMAGGLFLVLSDVILSRRKFRFNHFKDKSNALMYFAVTLHNIPEGMAVGVAIAQAGGGSEVASALLLAVGIGIQNFPEGMCVAFPLRQKGMSRSKSFFFSAASGMVEIPACILGAVAAASVGWIMPWALAFSAGAMIAVVCSELIPECYAGNKTIASVGVIFGFCLMAFLDLTLG